MQTKFHVAFLLVALQLAGASPVAGPLGIPKLPSLSRTSSADSRLNPEAKEGTSPPGSTEQSKSQPVSPKTNCKRGPEGCKDGSSATPAPPPVGAAAGQKRPALGTPNSSTGPGDTKTQKNLQGGSNPGGPNQDLQDRISNLPEYKGPVDLGRNQGAQKDVAGNDQTHHWIGNQIFQTKTTPSNNDLDKMAMDQAKHTTQQQNYKDMGAKAPNDLSAVFRPVNHPDCKGVVCLSSNVRASTKPAEVPNMSTFEQTQTDSLPKDKQKAKEKSENQGVHGEINAAEHLSNFMGDNPKNPQYPPGSMTTSVNLKDPNKLAFQASCGGEGVDCQDKMHNMNIQDLHPHAKGPKGAPAKQRESGKLDEGITPDQPGTPPAKKKRDVLLRRALENFLLERREVNRLWGVEKRELLMTMGTAKMVETY